MLSSSLLNGLRAVRSSVMIIRNLAATKKRLQTLSLDTLFLDKIREYNAGKLVEPSLEFEKELKSELEKLERQFGGGAGVDMTTFPTFKFEEPKLDPINEQAHR